MQSGYVTNSHNPLGFCLFPVAPWSPVCHMIFQYVSQIANSSHTQPLIQSQVENLLSKTYQKWKNRTLGSSDGPSVDEIPWDAILAVCIDHKLRDWKPPKLPVAPGILCPSTARITLLAQTFNNLAVVHSCIGVSGHQCSRDGALVLIFFSCCRMTVCLLHVFLLFSVYLLLMMT